MAAHRRRQRGVGSGSATAAVAQQPRRQRPNRAARQQIRKAYYITNKLGLVTTLAHVSALVHVDFYVNEASEAQSNLF